MKFWHAFVILIVLAGLIGGAVYAGNYLLSQKQQSEQSQWTPLPDQATTTNITASSTALSYRLPSATTTVPSSWKSYVSDELGYQIAYPADLSLNMTGSTLVLAFPNAGYFHWPLQDDAKVTISVASTCTVFNDVGPLSPTTTTFNLNGYVFIRHEGHDAAAGNIYNEWAYDTVNNGLCYRIDLFDHGANGAGLYVGDQSLIGKYDDQHTKDLNVVMDDWNTITASFRIRAVSVGTPEDQVLPTGH